MKPAAEDLESPASPGDPLMVSLASLPEEPIDGRVAASVQRRARAVFDRSRERTPQWARFSRVFSRSLLPAFLLACALVYAWESVQVIERVYLAGGG
jgi:hypothetical protein